MRKIFTILALIYLAAVLAYAQTTEFSYQGSLKDGANLANGNYDFEFALYDGGGAQLGGAQTRNGVAVANGIFSVSLDFGNQFSGAGRLLEIRVRLSGGGGFTTLTPRQPVNSSPYSVKSLNSDSAATATNAVNATNATTATNFSGPLAGDVTGTQAATTVARLQGRTVANTQPTGGQVLKFNSGTNQWQPDTDLTGSGGGGITGVTAGTGLSGGGTTGTVTVGIAPGGVSPNELATNAVTTTKILDANVTDAKIASIAGSKITGSIATATIPGANVTGAVATATNATTATSFSGPLAGDVTGTQNATVIASNAVTTTKLADSAVTATKIANGQVVKSINGLTDGVTLAAGSNVTITPSGNTLTIASTGGGGVGGSGLANILPIWTGAATLGNSAITQAGSDIGIGTGSPNARLHVLGSGSAPAILGHAATAGFTGVLGTSVSGSGVEGRSDSGIGVDSLGPIGVKAATLTSGGIALRTEGSSWFKGDSTPLSAARTGTGTGIVVGSSGNFGYISAFDYGAFQPRILSLNNSGGSVGIGTTNPFAKLDVTGGAGGANIAVQGTTTNDGIGVRGLVNSGTGVAGQTLSTGAGVSGLSQGAIGVKATNVGSGGIALLADGSSWFKGDSTPLSVANAGFGTGIVVGSAGTFGYMSAYDYSANQVRTLLLNNSGGNVGINTNTPDQALSVNGNASKAGGGSWLAFSDERLKNIKGRFNGGLKAVMKLQPLRYEYKKDNAIGLKSDGEHIGFSAQAVEKIIPEAVTKTEQGYRLVNNDPIIWAMLNAIKEQQATIEKLSTQVRQLQRANSRNNRIKTRK